MRSFQPVLSLFRGSFLAMSALAVLAMSASFNAQAQEAFEPEATFETGFSSHVDGSEQTALAVVLRAIAGAQIEIGVAAYEFTSAPIARALVAAHNRGVNVYVIADAKENSRGYTKIPYLEQNRIPVRLAASYDIFHNKFMLIDNQTVETGSFNYTAGAVDRNAENALVIRNSPRLFAHYAAIWTHLWTEAGQR